MLDTDRPTDESDRRTQLRRDAALVALVCVIAVLAAVVAVRVLIGVLS